MTQFESSVPQPGDAQPAPPLHADDVPARRLLAHEVEPPAWDDDGESPEPPPD